MKILLIRPKWHTVGRPNKVKLDVSRIPPLALGIVASLSPGEEVRIVNEDTEAVPFSEDWDLVGLTVHTFTADRAYGIADRFRERGVRVVLGGLHPTLLPAEGLAHADAVVIGEAEPVWPQVLADARAGRVAGLYHGRLPASFRSPPPARELFRPRNGLKYVQATRGCTRSCRFCYHRGLPGQGFRHRPVVEVVDEIRSFSDRVFFFTDDNLFSDRDYARELLGALAPLRRHFWVEAPTDVGLDEGLLEALRRAGCFAVTLGFQSVRAESVAEAGVLHNQVNRYAAIVDHVHRHGLFAEGYFVFGFDADPPDVCEETFDFICRSRLDDAVLHILTPIPGTPLFEDFQRQGRLLTRDYARYDWDHCVFQPRHLSAERLEQEVGSLYARLGARYRRQAPRALCRHAPLLWRAPVLAAFLLRAAFRRPRGGVSP